jgi:hypothetical protein
MIGTLGYVIHKKQTVEEIMQETESLRVRIKELENKLGARLDFIENQNNRPESKNLTQPDSDKESNYSSDPMIVTTETHENTKPINFYDLDLTERQKLVKFAVNSRKTLVSRWKSLASEYTDSWSLRAQRAAQMIGHQSSVVDLGCGMMTLENFLQPTTVYIPADVVRRDDRTKVVDLNKQDLPDFGAECLVGLGLIEYIFDVPKLLLRMSDCYSNVLLSYNSIDNYPNQDERTGHAWVNHFSIVEIESMLTENGFRIDEIVQHDATQTMWKLTSTKRLTSVDSGLLPKAKRIIFTCDFMRTSENLDFIQRSNITKIFEIMAPHVRATAISPVSLFPDLPDDEYKELILASYAAFGLIPSLESWASTYHASSLFSVQGAEMRMIELFKGIFSDSIVISFEASPMLKRVFERCAIAYIDVRAHSERFMDDLPLGFHSNSPAIREILKTYAHPREDFERACSDLRGSISLSVSNDTTPNNSIVFLAQTRHDSSVILPSGDFFDVEPCLDYVQKIVESYGSTNLLIKPHPLEPYSDVVQALLMLPNASLTNDNVYRLMSSEKVSAFVTFSSSTGHEAEAFQKPVHWISAKQPIRDYAPIMFEYRTSKFWHSIFGTLNTTPLGGETELNTKFEHNFIREKFNITWDARGTL